MAGENRVDTVSVAYRPSGSSAPYTVVTAANRSVYNSDAITLDPAYLGMAANTQYEVVILTSGLTPDNTSRRIRSRQIGSFYSGQPPSASLASANLANGGFTVMRAAGSSRVLDFFDLGRVGSGGTTVTSATLRYRVKGSTGAWSAPAGLPPRSELANGAFSWDWTGLAGGKYDFVVEGFNASGGAVTRVAGSVDLGAAPQVTGYQTFGTSASDVTISGQPASARSVVLRWTYKGMSGTNSAPGHQRKCLARNAG